MALWTSVWGNSPTHLQQRGLICATCTGHKCFPELRLPFTNGQSWKKLQHASSTWRARWISPWLWVERNTTTTTTREWKKKISGLNLAGLFTQPFTIKHHNMCIFFFTKAWQKWHFKQAKPTTKLLTTTVNPEAPAHTDCETKALHKVLDFFVCFFLFFWFNIKTLVYISDAKQSMCRVYGFNQYLKLTVTLFPPRKKQIRHKKRKLAQGKVDKSPMACCPQQGKV